MAAFEMSYASTGEMVDLVKTYKFRYLENANVAKDFAERGDFDWLGLQGERQNGEHADKTTLRLIEDGWTKGADLLDSVKNVDAPVATSIKRRNVWQDFGDEVDMQRVYAGNLDYAWRRTKRVCVNGPTRICIFIDSLASGYVESREMLWRGVAAMRLADTLTAAGYLVEIRSGFKGGTLIGKYDSVLQSVIVKPYDMPINLPVLAATTALPAFFRMMGHLLHPIARDMNGKTGYGVSYRVLPLSLADFPEEQGVKTFIVGQLVHSAEDVNTWLDCCMEAMERPYEDMAA
jgi:hypothetical protein